VIQVDRADVADNKVEPSALLAIPVMRRGAPARSFPPVLIVPFPRVSVVIPVLNEGRNILSVLEAIPADIFEVIVVDGQSTDDTVAIAHAWAAKHGLPLRVVQQPRRGKGDALIHGFAHCGGDVIVTLDGDGSTDAAEIPRFIAALRAGAELAKGSRFAPGGGSADITPLRRWGNRVLTMLVNRLYRTNFTDLCYGYNAFWRDCLEPLDLVCDGFEIETLLNVRAARRALVVAEVPSVEARRAHGASNLHPLRDGLRVLRVIVGERLKK